MIYFHLAIVESLKNTIPAEAEIHKNAILSVLLLILVAVIRFICRKAILKSTLKSEELKQKWLVQIRNMSFLVALFCLMIIWGSELRTLALSLLAITAAIVIATKELILCVTGSLFKAGTSAFSVGDKISVGTYRGIVADQNLLSTVLFEIGPGQDSHQLTGKTLVIPNSLFLTQVITNENNSISYTLHSYSIKTKKLKHAMELEKLLLKAIEKLSSQHVMPSQKSFKKVFPGKEIGKNTCQPRIISSQVDAETVKFQMRFPIPSADVGRAEQELMRVFLEWNEQGLQEEKVEDEKK
ncbi:MAG: mechanosensitive ion channel family protein [Lentisphaeraceae bacterium]|nr:mechanosensitive ion channel family protein [Lentisphaeraceae bacterium]